MTPQMMEAWNVTDAIAQFIRADCSGVQRSLTITLSDFFTATCAIEAQSVARIWTAGRASSAERK